MSSTLPSRFYRGALSLARRRRRKPISARVIDGLVECPCCGEYQAVRNVEPGMMARCVRCGFGLERRNMSSPIATPLALCISSAALYFATLMSSLMTLNLYGRQRAVELVTGPMELLHEGWGEVGVLVGLVTVLAPGVVITMMALILYAGGKKEMPDWAPHLLAWYEKLRPWSMMEVYILGIFVAYTKLVDLAYVEVGPAAYLIAALMVTMAATDQTLDKELIWRRRRVENTLQFSDGTRVAVERVSISDIPMPPVQNMLSCYSCGLVGAFEQPVPRTHIVGSCPRCGHKMRRRKPDSLNRTAALLLASLICYFPANIYPVMTVIKLGQGGGHTILGGVVELWQDGMIPLSILVLFASITVPVAKILGLAFMLFETYRGSSRGLMFRSKLFRVIDAIGRWSMIDVFMISILVAVVRFSSLANVTADGGVVCFAAVVVLTIFAAEAFDPRLMWDAAGKNGPAPAADPPVASRKLTRTVQNDGTEDRQGMEPASA
ncbi:paraquat-inducible protein A [Acetobacter sacchari]|uniref:Paraquat-inducible protein A n=1 Tax=Acetobacter sacchari TaxID=2661687 RepID=A0ABS3LVN8_9PROT|nr:paraquat-inducible protein A [Acetobacter sacchari]